MMVMMMDYLLFGLVVKIKRSLFSYFVLPFYTYRFIYIYARVCVYVCECMCVCACLCLYVCAFHPFLSLTLPSLLPPSFNSIKADNKRLTYSISLFLTYLSFIPLFILFFFVIIFAFFFSVFFSFSFFQNRMVCYLWWTDVTFGHIRWCLIILIS